MTEFFCKDGRQCLGQALCPARRIAQGIKRDAKTLGDEANNLERSAHTVYKEEPDLCGRKLTVTKMSFGLN